MTKIEGNVAGGNDISMFLENVNVLITHNDMYLEILNEAKGVNEFVSSEYDYNTTRKFKKAIGKGKNELQKR